MFCIHCGEKNKDTAKFCMKCGQELSITENNPNDCNNSVTANISRATTATTNKPSFMNFYFSAKGRISRKEFFFKGFIPTSLMIVILLLGANFLPLQEASKTHVFIYSLIVVLSIVVVVAQFTVSIKRLHDYDASGWWSIGFFIPIVNFITLMFLFFKSPSNKENKYGDKPEDYALTPFKWFIFIISLLLIWGVIVTNGVLTHMNKEQDTQKINEIEHPKPEIEHSKPTISVNATSNPYEIDINTIIKWYNADTGLNNQSGVTDGFKIKNQTSESVRYNGEIRGWSYWYIPKGTKGIKRRKYFYNPDDSNADSKGRVSGKWFRYYYCQETEYARFGDGENYPLFWLKDGKPFDGQLKIGEGQLGWYRSFSS